MAKCPQCNTDVSIKISDQVTCPTCNSSLVATFTPWGKLIVLLAILAESAASLIIVVGVSLIDNPAIPKWIMLVAILLGLTIATVVLAIFITNRVASLRLK